MIVALIVLGVLTLANTAGVVLVWLGVRAQHTMRKRGAKFLGGELLKIYGRLNHLEQSPGAPNVYYFPPPPQGPKN